MLNPENTPEFKANQANPTRSMSDALAFAALNGQTETYETILACADEFTRLVMSMVEDETIPEEMVSCTGCLGYNVQYFLDTTSFEDARIDKLREMSKTRFLLSRPGPHRLAS